MPRPSPLPSDFDGRAFAYGDARSRGVPRSRIRLPDVAHPHRGVYSTVKDRDSLVARCGEVTQILGGMHVFSHVTAARLWGMPLPWRWTADEDVHVLAAGERARLRRPGIRSWETAIDDLIPYRIGDLLVPEPALVWAQLAGMTRPRLDQEWLVAAGDFLVSGIRLPAAQRSEPLASLETLQSVIRARTGMRGTGALRTAMPLVRTDVDSPQESRLRLALVAAGLPEPQIHPAVQTAAGILHPDLGYLAARVLLEYQGDEHRADRRRWLDDLTRVQLFQDASYHPILVGADDLRGPGRAALVARIRRLLR
jgi:hypothetical protein